MNTDGLGSYQKNRS